MRLLLQRLSALLALSSLVLSPLPASAQGNSFDLAGPALTMAVTREKVTLPIGQVPSLRIGDQLELKADLPADQAARYLLVLVFLRGATNPPPKNWFYEAETWNPKKATLSVKVPEGAQQAIALMAPETGGGYNALVKAVRGRPGVFVRAAQDLYQASLDRARLETFVNGVARVEESAPERLVPVSTALAGSLGIKLNADCLARSRALQASCLTQNRDGMVLQTGGGAASMIDVIGGTTTQFAYSLAATKEGGAGEFSPYISLARDFARLFGVFRSADYQYAPALAVGQNTRLRLQLNTPPSFQNPKSVLVAPLPPIGSSPPPPLRAALKDAVCLAKPGLVLPLEDAPLVFATDYARALTLRLALADGRTVELPVAADAERGGLVVGPDAQKLGGSTIGEAVLTGRWGFDSFTGPRFPLQNGAPAAWQPKPDDTVVVGRDAPLTLRGGAAACVEQVALRDRSGTIKPVEWKASAPDEITATLPLQRARPGDLTLLVSHFGASAPAQLTLKGQSEASRLEGFTLYTGDKEGRLVGARLDQVASLEVAGLTFTAGALSRDMSGGDRLALTTEANTETVPTGTSDAKVTLKDGRTTAVRATITPPRPRLELVSRSVAAPATPGRLALELPAFALAPEATLTFSARAVNTRLSAGDLIEVATADDSASAKLSVASGKLQLIGSDVAVASLTPREALGAAATGPLKLRLVQGELVGDWQPLARVVRLPELTELRCEGATCALRGSELFLIAQVAEDAGFQKAQNVPLGFVGGELTVPHPIDGALYLKLHDAPDDAVKLVVPAAMAKKAK
ncbi:hypothetical protein [Sphingomonas sp. BK580]|uniref:hypothetical protein n=1 Tax=Sphingomonas sp. BK580 TaxID=2586972 RepID=UPI001619CDCB|nr:hypothetical protein [Sphingomonas sp. BK580]MBB3695083.1 hypothetical protein [Sphingomonas sp. BK580]